METLIRLLRQPYGPLLPWFGLAGLLTVVYLIVHTTFLASAQEQRAVVQAEWTAARQRLVQHMEAKKIRRDLDQVMAVLPAERDFAPLALGVTEEAKRDNVTLPALSYRTEATGVPGTTKAILQGAVSGRYEDLRRFIYNLETAEELLFIEDLDVVRSGNSQDERLTFNIKIVTFLRGEAGRAAVPSKG